MDNEQLIIHRRFKLRSTISNVGEHVMECRGDDISNEIGHHRQNTYIHHQSHIECDSAARFIMFDLNIRLGVHQEEYCAKDEEQDIEYPFGIVPL